MTADPDYLAMTPTELRRLPIEVGDQVARQSAVIGCCTRPMRSGPDGSQSLMPAMEAVDPMTETTETKTSWPATRDIVLPRDEQMREPDPVALVLGLAAQPWTLNSIARLLRDSGEVSIPTRAEAEMAAALHWLLGLVFQHGDDWSRVYAGEADRMRATIKAKAEVVAS